MPACELKTLGAFSFRIDGRAVRSPATQKARALLVCLVMHRAAEVARERLVELFWPDSEPDRARESLRTALYSIRRVLRDAGCDPDALIYATKSVIRWNPETEFDAERLVEFAKRADSETHVRALALYGGEFLEGDYDEWAVAERERLAGVYERLLSRAHAASGDADVARRLIERNPYDEAPYLTLIEAELIAGRIASASKIARALRAALCEVGAVPSRAFEERYGRLEDVDREEPAQPQLAFCGRKGELARIRDLLDAGTVREDRLVVVHGEPGIGKTWFFERAFGLARSAGLDVRPVRSIDGDPRPFGMWGTLYESLALGDFAAYLSRAEGDIRHRLAATLCGAFAKRTLVCVDDVQYLRDDQLAMLEPFVRAALAAGHVVCLGTRPEGLRVLDARFGDTARVELALERLVPAELADGLEAAGFTNVTDCAQVLAKKTGGLPLFVASLLETLAKHGGLRRDGRRWTLARDALGSIALPRTLARSIESRIRARGDCTAAVACALALEPEANADDVGTVLGFEENVVLDALDDLLALGIVVEPASGDRFAFAHDLVRDVSATLLNRNRRERLHAAFADRLAGVGAGAGLIRRARHEFASERFLAAGQTYYDAAGDAMHVRAFNEASARCDLGLEGLRRAPESNAASAVAAALCVRKAAIGMRSGGMEKALAAAKSAVVHARASRDPRVLARTLNMRAGIYDNAHLWHDALHDAQAGLDIANSLDDANWRAKLLMRIISAHQSLHDHAAASALGDEAIAAAIAGNDPVTVACAAGTVFRGRLVVWNFAEAQRSLELQEVWTRRCGAFSEKYAARNRAFFWYHVGEFDLALQALPSSEEVLKAADQMIPSDITVSVGDLLMSLELLQALVGAARGDLGPSFRLSTLGQRLPDIAWNTLALHCMKAARIDALLARNAPEDSEHAEALTETVADDDFAAADFDRGSVYTPYVLRARVAARRRLPGANVRLATAVDAAELDAKRAPTDFFRALHGLGEAADEIGASMLAQHAFALRDIQLERHARAKSDCTVFAYR